MNSIRKITNFVQHLIKDQIKEGSIVLDGTMGNGNDTVFLAKAVGPSGFVYSFDIQKLAIENTEKLIEENNLGDHHIYLIQDGHENLKVYVDKNIDVAMFNLGYLPKGDHSIITRGESTIKAISDVLELLNPKGRVSIVIYYGHDGGEEEKNNVLNFLESLPSKNITVLQCTYLNHDNNPPIIIILEKNK